MMFSLFSVVVSVNIVSSVSLEVIHIVRSHVLRGRARQALSLLLLQELLLSV